MSKEHNIILKPIISEKSTIARETTNQYGFEVAVDTTKQEVKKAVEKLFNVKVESVNIINQIGKKKRVRQQPGMTSSVKKAIVRVKADNKIKFFEGK
ncbi:50S ribosomal protein L23 [Candidatus Dependentiae bacterium]|nr:50S ribosomal protein L23 [Candidatus Dependentiae bacterium]